MPKRGTETLLVATSIRIVMTADHIKVGVDPIHPLITLETGHRSLFIQMLCTLHFWYIPTWRFPCSSVSKDSASNAGDLGLILGSRRSPEKEMATHSSILAWRIPWTEEPGGLQSMMSKTWTRLSNSPTTTILFVCPLTVSQVSKCAWRPIRKWSQPY